MANTKILIVGAHGAMGGHSLLKLYGNGNLSVVILQSEMEAFLKEKQMTEDKWFPSDTTTIPKDAFFVGREPSSSKEVGVFTPETLPAGFFKENGIVVVASKIFHYDSVVDTIQPALNRDTIIFVLVNGLKPELTLERKCREKGIENTLIRAVVMGGTHHTIEEDSCRYHSGIAKFVIGNWNMEFNESYKSKMEKVAGLYPDDTFLVEPRYGNEYRSPCFDKVLANLVNPISAFTGCVTFEYVKHTITRKIITRCFNQGIAVGLAIGLPLADYDAIIRGKLEMYEKAGKAAKAHLPSMGQDALRALLNRTVLHHENEHIGVALVKEGREAKAPYDASFVDSFNRILTEVTEHYNVLYRQDKEAAAHFLIGLMMRNRYSLGLDPHNRPLYEQFGGLEEIESHITLDRAKLKSITAVDEAPIVFRENLEEMMDLFLNKGEKAQHPKGEKDDGK